MLDSDLLWLADANLAEYLREQARWLPGHSLDERDSQLLIAAGSRFPSLNCAIPLGEPIDEPAAWLDRACRFFAPLERSFSAYAPSHRGAELGPACEARGWEKLSDAPGMVLREPAALPSIDRARFELHAVTAGQRAADFVEVSARAFEAMQLPADLTRRVFSQRQRWLRPQFRAFVGYEGGEPTSAAAFLLSHGIAGIYWVGTVPDARGRGHAAYVTAAAGNEAFECGARVVVLQASPFGEAIYRRLGYREFTRYPWYLAPKSA